MLEVIPAGLLAADKPRVPPSIGKNSLRKPAQRSQPLGVKASQATKILHNNQTVASGGLKDLFDIGFAQGSEGAVPYDLEFLAKTSGDGVEKCSAVGGSFKEHSSSPRWASALPEEVLVERLNLQFLSTEEISSLEGRILEKPAVDNWNICGSFGELKECGPQDLWSLLVSKPQQRTQALGSGFTQQSKHEFSCGVGEILKIQEPILERSSSREGLRLGEQRFHVVVASLHKECLHGLEMLCDDACDTCLGRFTEGLGVLQVVFDVIGVPLQSFEKHALQQRLGLFAQVGFRIQFEFSETNFCVVGEGTLQFLDAVLQ